MSSTSRSARASGASVSTCSNAARAARTASVRFETPWRQFAPEGSIPNVDAVRAARAAFEHVDELAPEARADYDVLLTDSVIRLGYHLRFGKVDPVALDSDWNFGRELVSQDPVKTIQAAIDARSMREFANEVIPRNFLYRRLKTALAEYRAIADRGGWPTSIRGPRSRPA